MQARSYELSACSSLRDRFVATTRTFGVLTKAFTFNLFVWRPHDVECFLTCVSTQQQNIPQNNDSKSIVSFLSDGYTFISIIAESAIETVLLLNDKHFS